MPKHIKDTRDEDVIAIAENLRKADQLELQAYYGHARYLSILKQCVNASHRPLTVFNGDTPVAVFGVCDGPGCDIPWMLGTDDMAANKKTFMADSRRVAQQWFKQYPFLVNYVDCRNTVSIAWLKRLGFTMGRRCFFSDPLVPFFQFEYKEV